MKRKGVGRKEGRGTEWGVGDRKKPEGQEFLIIYYLFPGLLSLKNPDKRISRKKYFSISSSSLHVS
jgi:hypothetical protein